MNSIKYFFQFFIIFFLFIIFKILGLKLASNFSSWLLKIFGPFFRSKKIIEKNILKAFPTINHKDLKKIITDMWGNYGRILSEYVFLKNFRGSQFKDNLEIVGQDFLEEIKKEGKPVIFVHGWPESWYSWRHQIDPFKAAGYKVIIPDIRGYGRSDKPKDINSYSLNEITKDLIGILNYLNDDTAHIIGHDWGAPISWYTSLLFPERVFQSHVSPSIISFPSTSLSLGKFNPLLYGGLLSSSAIFKNSK